MKKLFPGYYQPTQNEFTYLWDNCIFSLDSNVLLNLYRYTPNTRLEFLKILDRITKRLWISHQVALEYQQNRLSVIAQQKNSYSEVMDILNNAQKNLEGKLGEYRRHPYIDIPSLIKRSDKLFTAISKELEIESKEHPDLLKNDDLRSRITKLLEGRVGLPYSTEKLTGIYEEGEKRYQVCIPPGYMDAKDKKDNSKYSDLVLWLQIMDKAKELKTPVILISDDAKEDWWWIFSGRTIGPRPELIEEFINFTKMNFYMYSSDKFMEYARDYFRESIGQKAIDEVQNIRRDEEDKNIFDSLNKQIQEIGSSEIEQLKLNWRRIFEELPVDLRRTKAVAWLKAGSQPISIDNENIILGCRYMIFKENLEKPENKEIVEKILSNALGHPCHANIVCIPEPKEVIQ
jgi:hypothetical protein